MKNLEFVILLFGVAFIAIALWLTLKQVAVLRSGGRADGVVAGYERKEDPESVFYFPVVEFRDHQGRVIRTTLDVGTDRQDPPIGASIPIRYLQRDPKVAAIASFKHLWAPQVVFAVFGAACVLGWLWSQA